MYINKLTLRNFRNYDSQSVKFINGLNVVVGKNASGKTNMLESIYCCAIGKSPRTTRFKDLVEWEKNYAYIKIELIKKYRSHTIELSIDSQDKKRVLLDGVPLTKISDLLGMLNVVYFSPDELKLIKESPQERRRFMDISLSQQSKTYMDCLSKYNNLIARRNKLLKEKHSFDALKEMLYVWDIQIAKYGSYIIKKRYEFVQSLDSFAKNIHSTITDNKENLSLEYESKLKEDSQALMQKDFLTKLQDSITKDINLQYTSVGAHRDDISIAVNNIDVRKFGSQGQQRTSALSLKLAEIDHFKCEVGETPILLLDDVLSELDEGRRQKLMELSTGLQTLITCTDFDMKVAHNTIEICSGKVKE